METVKQQTLKGVKWSVIERFSMKGIQFILSLVLARLLVPEDFGIIGMLSIFFAISQSIIDSGFSNALIRKNDRTEIDFSTVFYFNIVVGVICYFILFLLAPTVSDFFKKPILCPILRVLSINLFINSLSVVQVAKLTIDVDFKTQAKASTIAALLSGVVGVIIAYLGYGVWSLVFQSVLSTMTNVCLLWFYSKWKPLFVFSWKSFSELFSFGSKLLASGLLHTIYMNMTTLVIGRFYTAEQLGYYTRGYQFSQLPSENVTGILQRVTFPVFSKIQDDIDYLMSVYRKYIRISSLLIFFMMVLLAALARPLILFVLSDKWSEAIPYLQVFCFAMMFDHICQINLNLLQVKGRSDLFLRLEIVKKIISFVILLASIPFGVFVICLSKVIYTQIAVVINTYYTGKLYGLGYIKQCKDFVPYLAFSILCCLPSFFLAEYSDHYFLVLIIGGLVSSALYIVTLYLIKDKVFFNYCTPYFEKLKNGIRLRTKK